MAEMSSFVPKHSVRFNRMSDPLVNARFLYATKAPQRRQCLFHFRSHFNPSFSAYSSQMLDSHSHLVVFTRMSACVWLLCYEIPYIGALDNVVPRLKSSDTRLQAWEFRCRNKLFNGSIYFSSATCFGHSTILKWENTIRKYGPAVIGPIN
jgi:hypothetical protein